MQVWASAVVETNSFRQGISLESLTTCFPCVCACLCVFTALQAALGAIRCYLSLCDAPAAAAAAEEAAEAQLAALSPEERKKEKLRRKKV